MKATFLFAVTLMLGILTAPRTLQAQFLYTTNNGTITITGYTGLGGDVIIPSTLDGLPVTDIGDSAFKERDLTSLTVPDSITTIGDSAFLGCTNLAIVTIGNSVITIGSKAFMSCNSLASVTVPNSVTVIGDWAFARCYGLTNVTLSDGLTRIGEGAFYLCTSLGSVAIPDSVISLDDWAFSRCAYLENVTLGNNLARIEDRAFSSCVSLTSIAIPDSVESIGTKAFSSCYSLTNVTIGRGVTEIEAWAFSYCFKLITVTIGEGLSRIGDFAFFLCANLEGVYFKGDQPTFVSSGLFAGADHATVYYLPGTAGWGPTFDGLPTALWSLPGVMLNFSAGVGVQTNGFGFAISSAADQTVVVETCDSLHSSAWFPVATNALRRGRADFKDPEWKSRPMRFYRVRAQ
jgi:hypothetical protein